MLQAIQTMVCHVDMDAFYASAEILRNPSLEGKPVVVGGGAGERLGVVAASSYKAREYGIRSGTPIFKARQLCSSLVIIHPDFKYYNLLSERVMQAMSNVSPDIKPLSIDEALVDITGVLKLWGSPMKAAALIKEKVMKSTGLKCTVGAARFPIMAKMAAKIAKPHGLLVILPGKENTFCSDYPLSKVPGVGRALTKYYRYFGLNTIGDMIRHHPTKWDKILLSCMSEQVFPKSVSASLTLDRNTECRSEVFKTLETLCNKCGTKMRRKKVKAKDITVILRYSDFQTFVLSDHRKDLKFDNDIKAEAKKLFRRIDIQPLPIRLVGVRLSNFMQDYGDVPVLDGDAAVKKVKLYHVMDSVRHKYKHIELINQGPQNY